MLPPRSTPSALVTLFAVGCWTAPPDDAVELPDKPPACQFEVETLSRTPARRLLWADSAIAIFLGPDPANPNGDQIYTLDRATRRVARRGPPLPRITDVGGQSMGEVVLATNDAILSLSPYDDRAPTPLFSGRTDPAPALECPEVFGRYWIEPRSARPNLYFGFPHFEPERLAIAFEGPASRFFVATVGDGCSLVALVGDGPARRLEHAALRAPREVAGTSTIRSDVLAVAECDFGACVAVASPVAVGRYGALDGPALDELALANVTTLASTDRELVYVAPATGDLRVTRWSGAEARIGLVVAPRDLRLTRDGCVLFVDAESGADPNHPLLRGARYRR